MTTLAPPLDRTRELTDLSLDLSLDLSVVTIESLVARDISAFSERNRRTTDRAGARVISPASA